MLPRLKLKVIKFQLNPPTHLSTVVNTFFFGVGGMMPPSPCQIGLSLARKCPAKFVIKKHFMSGSGKIVDSTALAVRLASTKMLSRDQI